MHRDAEPADGVLIAAVLAGETERFAQIVRRYQGALLRVARSRLGRRDWAEDVVQETFLCAFKSLHSYDSRYNFRTWLWTIMINQCRRHLQRRSRRPWVGAWTDVSKSDTSAADADDARACESPSPPAVLLAKERSRRLAALLAELPDAQADALRLRFFGGLKFQEIADAMGCSLSSAKNRVRWGLTRLSQRIGPDEAQALTAAQDRGAADSARAQPVTEK